MSWSDGHGHVVPGVDLDGGRGLGVRRRQPRPPGSGGGPSLISAWDGTPTGYGAGVREHLLAEPAADGVNVRAGGWRA